MLQEISDKSENNEHKKMMLLLLYLDLITYYFTFLSSMLKGHTSMPEGHMWQF